MMTHIKRKRRSARYYKTIKRLQRLAFWIAVIVVLFYTLFPYYWAVVSSTKQGAELFGTNWLPAWDFRHYAELFRNKIFARSLLNSAIVATSTTLLSLILASTAAYALGRMEFRGRKFTLMAILMVSIFPQIVVLAGMFELVNLLGLFNNLGALIFAYMITTVPFTTWILTSFMQSFPRELEEAATMDGCSPLRILTHIVMPLIGPALASTGLLAFILAWNEFLFALTFILTDDQRTVPVAIGLLGGASHFEYPFGPVMAASIVVTLPLIVLVQIFQKKVVSGLTSGAVKG